MPKICIDMILYKKWEKQGYCMDRFVSADMLEKNKRKRGIVNELDFSNNSN